MQHNAAFSPFIEENKQNGFLHISNTVIDSLCVLSFLCCTTEWWEMFGCQQTESNIFWKSTFTALVLWLTPPPLNVGKIPLVIRTFIHIHLIHMIIKNWLKGSKLACFFLFSFFIPDQILTVSDTFLPTLHLYSLYILESTWALPFEYSENPVIHFFIANAMQLTCSCQSRRVFPCHPSICISWFSEWVNNTSCGMSLTGRSLSVCAPELWGSERLCSALSYPN